MDESESERDATNIEIIGSYLSNLQLKNRTNNVEEESFRSLQLKKRKRNIMNDVQISMIENALCDEPNMQRRTASVQLWADKLSRHVRKICILSIHYNNLFPLKLYNFLLQGSEITYSQLKNW